MNYHLLSTKKKMSKLIMLSGLPASGKSTKAKEIVETGNYIRVNRDLLRTMMHFDKWSGRNEKFTVSAEKFLTYESLKSDLNVVVDDTNLNPKNKLMWQGVAKDANASFEHIHIDTDWLECCLRDSHREKKVGNNVIKNMALQYGLAPVPTKGWVLVDLDGTLADVEHRRHLVQGPKKDWKGFFNLIPSDPVRMEVSTQIIQLYNQGYNIIYVSARPESYREMSLNWLTQHGLGFGWTLLMRRDDDGRPDTLVKQGILDTYFPDKSKIFKVFDDRPSVIRMWRGNGLEVVDVGNGEEF